MYDIDNEGTLGLYKAHKVCGTLPIPRPVYNFCNIMWLTPSVQQLELYDAQMQPIKVYRRYRLPGGVELSDWQEMV